LSKRLFNFSVITIKECRALPNDYEYKIILYQLIKSVTSSAANYEESQAGVSKKDFSNKVEIALKEMRETNYWLWLIIEINKSNSNFLQLEKESKELMKILGSIFAKTSKQR